MVAARIRPLTARPSWLVATWSRPAALRALRTTLVVPGLFAFAYLVVGNLQIATFAAFGGFATLVLASFGGSRRDRLLAHLGLAVAGSVLLTIGTAVSASTAVAAVVTLPVVFAVLFAGVLGPNVASGGTAALLAYVLPAASPGTLQMVPSRLAGWWLASAVGTVAVLLLSPRPAGDRLREAAAAAADALADQLEAVLGAVDSGDMRTAVLSAKHALLEAFTSTPYRPTGLATADQGLAGVVESVEWASAAVLDTLTESALLARASTAYRELLLCSARVLRSAADLLRGAPAWPDFDDLERRRAAPVAAVGEAPGSGRTQTLHLSFHARVVAIAARNTAAEALIASRRADPGDVAALRRRWYGVPETGAGRDGRHPVLAGFGRVATGHASLRSVWFVNSLRGAVAIAAAITVADLTNVQHGFWVVLGTLSVLRTNAASTGVTAMRALVGTVAGFVVGAALILAIGANRTVLWAILPAAVLVAAYAPGTAPLAVGQAAFTVVVSVLYNLLVPVGWQVGVLRVEDVAIGCAVSVVVGALFWPRGAAGVVGDDLADAFRQGAEYLAQAVHWALGLREAPPDRAAAAVTAGLRLDEALRGFLTEQGTKRLRKEDLWRMVGAAMRLRLTAHSLAKLHDEEQDADPTRRVIEEHAERLAGWYQELARLLARPVDRASRDRRPRELDGLAAYAHTVSAPSAKQPRQVWVALHLDHLREHLPELVGPAAEIVALRRRPWWR